MQKRIKVLCKRDIPVRLFLVCLGNVILGFGNAVCLKTGLGADPLNVLYQGIAAACRMPEGTASLMAAAVMLTVTFFLDRRQLGVGTLVAPFFFSFGIDWGMKIVREYMWFPVNYAMVLTGLCVISFGIAVSIYANFGKSSSDAMIFSLMHKTGLEYYKVRWGTDILYLALGVLLGGRITLATVIAVIVMGKIITFFVHLLEKTNIIENQERK